MKLDYHPHILERMQQRGVNKDEVERAMNEGWAAEDAKKGTLGKVIVFPFGKEWEGQMYEEKEVTVYYKMRADDRVLLTVKARYGGGFLRKDQ